MFEKNYPYLATWAATQGRIEIGYEYETNSILRIIDEGGMVWEDEESNTIDEALKRGEKYLKTDLAKDFDIELEIE